MFNSFLYVYQAGYSSCPFRQRHGTEVFRRRQRHTYSISSAPKLGAGSASPKRPGTGSILSCLWLPWFSNPKGWRFHPWILVARILLLDLGLR